MSSGSVQKKQIYLSAGFNLINQKIFDLVCLKINFCCRTSKTLKLFKWAIFRPKRALNQEKPNLVVDSWRLSPSHPGYFISSNRLLHPFNTLQPNPVAPDATLRRTVSPQTTMWVTKYIHIPVKASLVVSGYELFHYSLSTEQLQDLSYLAVQRKDELKLTMEKNQLCLLRIALKSVSFK